MIGSNYGANLNAEDLAQTKTVRDLFELIRARKQ
jgi:acyl carrier protein